jgi:hypothetical protein
LGLARAVRLENYILVFKSDNFVPSVAQQFGQDLLGIPWTGPAKQQLDPLRLEGDLLEAG